MKLRTILALILLIAVPADARQGGKGNRGQGAEPGRAQAGKAGARGLGRGKDTGRDGKDRRPEPEKVEQVSIDGVKPLSRVGRVFLAGQPTPAALEVLIGEGVNRVIDLRTRKEDRGFDEPGRAEALGAKYASLPFGGPVPLTDEIIDEVRGTLRRYRGEGRGKLLIHCASSNRVGGVWLAARVLDEGVPYEVALAQARAAGLRSPKYEEYARLYILGGGSHGLGEWIEKIREEFPGVKGLSVQVFARVWNPKRADREQVRPLLIDVRRPAEYEVSHIQGAKNAGSVGAVRKLLRDVPKDCEIVVYCSIGYRSAAMARDLAEMGYTKVRNLEGSIFEWANTGHPVFRGEKRVKEVHPFDEDWGKLLRRDLWADAAKR